MVGSRSGARGTGSGKRRRGRPASRPRAGALPRPGTGDLQPNAPRVWTPERAGEIGVRVERVVEDSAADRTGMAVGDVILAVDGEPVRDCLDVLVLADSPSFTLEVAPAAGGDPRPIAIVREWGEFHGLVLEDPPIKQCTNFCPFCFVDQAPPDRRLRRGLEIKDDDYRYSFLYGHYVTLTNLGSADLDRIRRYGLSPLYISVQATDPKVREQLLGRPKVPILPLLDRLAECGITIHTQVVLIPGLNDGAVLARSIDDLWARHPAVQSVAIVPVGLTSHHHKGVPGWTPESARLALDAIDALTQRHPAGFVQAADEWFSILGEDPPPAAYYAGMAIEENGVGMVRRMLDDWAAIRLPRRVRARSGLVITGRSPERWMARLLADINRVPGADFTLVPVTNHTYGPVTTVTGLLGWSDIAAAVAAFDERTLWIPDVMLTADGRFLDDITVEEAAMDSGRILKIVPSTAAGLATLID